MIICAAVKFKVIKTEQEVIIPCLRHHYAFEIIRDLGFKVGEVKHIDDGFIDHHNNFLNREEAYIHAVECGQLSISTKQFKEMRNEDELYSEDLY